MIHITHARIINSDLPTIKLRLNIRVPKNSLDKARELIKEMYQATRVNLTYTEYEPVR